MDKIEELLADIKKTNPNMTRDKLLEELRDNFYSSSVLFMFFSNSKKYFDRI